MFPSIHGVVSQASTPGWWEAGGATGAVAVYQPKGAASLAASYTDLSGNGNDATIGVAPTWDAANGWIFNGTTQYLKSGIVPPSGLIDHTMIFRFTGGTDGLKNVGGCDNMGLDATRVVYRILPSQASQAKYQNGGLAGAAPGLSSGILGLAGGTGYRNGISEVTVTRLSATTHGEIYMGARSLGASPTEYYDGEIQAVAIYSSALTAPQVLAVTNAMAAL